MNGGEGECMFWWGKKKRKKKWYVGGEKEKEKGRVYTMETEEEGVGK